MPTSRSRNQRNGGAAKAAAVAHVPDNAGKALARLLVGVTKLVFVLDDEGRVAGISESLLQQLNLSEDQLIGRPLTDILDGDALSLSSLGDGSVRLRQRDGGMLNTYLRASNVEVGNGRHFRVCILEAPGDYGDERVDVAVVSKVRMREEFNRSLEDRFASREKPQEAMASRIELICLDDLKAKLGSQWTRLKGRTKAIARSIIDRRLTEGDVFAEAEDDSFVICFATLSADEAHFKSERIAQEIREKLLGDEAPPFKVQAQVARVRFTEPDLSGGSDLLATLFAQLDEAREARAQYLQATGEQLVKSARLILSPLITSDPATAGMAAAKLGGESVSLLNRIMGTESEAKAIFDLDTLVLALAIKRLFADGGTRLSALIVPVHYRTLAAKRVLNDYLTLCERIDAGTRKRICFELHAIPRDAPPSRLQDMFGYLGPFSARRAMRVGSVAPRIGDLSRYRLAMISLPARREYASSAAASRAFATFVTLVHGQGCQLLIRDVPDGHAAAWYFENRVDSLFLANNQATSGASAIEEQG